MLAKIKIGTPGGGLPATKHTQKQPENTGALLEPLASCARSYQRVDAAENVHNRIDGPHVSGAHLPNESLKGWIVKKAVDPFGLPV
jgi:hypothetical protein